MKVFSSAFVAACFAINVAAQGVIVVFAPANGQSYEAGSTAKLQWGPADKPPLVAKTMDIDLVYGDANNALFAMNIVTDLDASQVSYNWPIPPSIVSKSDYFLKFTHKSATAGQRAYSYSSRFVVNGGNGSAPTTSATNPSSSPSSGSAAGNTGGNPGSTNSAASLIGNAALALCAAALGAAVL